MTNEGPPAMATGVFETANGNRTAAAELLEKLEAIVARLHGGPEGVKQTTPTCEGLAGINDEIKSSLVGCCQAAEKIAAILG